MLDSLKYFHEYGINWVECYSLFQDKNQTLPDDFIPDPADLIANFAKAKRWAKSHDIKYLYSGSRLNDIHDKHCSIFQDNLTITPDGFLSACFLATHNQNGKNGPYIYGHYDSGKKNQIIDKEKLDQLFSQLSEKYPQCKNCFNYFHCAKGCPAFCPIKNSSINPDKFDCTMEKSMGLMNIFETANVSLPDSLIGNPGDLLAEVSISILA